MKYYEVLYPDFDEIDDKQTDLYDIELNDVEYVIPDEKRSIDIEDNTPEISFGLFSNDNYEDNLNDKLLENIDYNDQNQESIELDVETDNNFEDSSVEYIKLDLNQDIEQNKDTVLNSNVDDIDNINLESVEENKNIFEQPIDPSNGDDITNDDDHDENSIRKKNLKKYNYVFKNNNSSIEDLEKIPAYKRMGIEIDNLKQLSEETYSKTVLNDENKLEFPDVNTYLHDNVD